MIQLEIANYEKFQAGLARAKRTASDLTIPLTLIAGDFYKSEKAIFELKSPGQYADLSPGYKPRKLRKWGRIYPILLASGALRDSVTSGTDANSISQIVNKDTLVIGTRVPYGRFHQEGTARMPARPFLFIGPESRYATSEQQGRVGRWLNILNAFVLKKLEEVS